MFLLGVEGVVGRNVAPTALSVWSSDGYRLALTVDS